MTTFLASQRNSPPPQPRRVLPLWKCSSASSSPAAERLSTPAASPGRQGTASSRVAQPALGWHGQPSPTHTTQGQRRPFTIIILNTELGLQPDTGPGSTPDSTEQVFRIFQSPSQNQPRAGEQPSLWRRCREGERLLHPVFSCLIPYPSSASPIKPINTSPGIDGAAGARRSRLLPGASGLRSPCLGSLPPPGQQLSISIKLEGAHESR